jgi:hypothetical protein
MHDTVSHRGVGSDDKSSGMLYVENNYTWKYKQNFGPLKALRSKRRSSIYISRQLYLYISLL